LHEIDPNLASPRLKVSLYDDCKSSLPLESSFVDDIPYTDLEEPSDPHLTSSSLVAPSSSTAPISTNISALTLRGSPLRLAQCTGLEMSEPYKGDVTVLEDDFPTRLKEPILVESHLEEAPFDELYDDSLVVGATASFDHIDPICTEPLESTPISSPVLPSDPSHLHAFHESLGDIRGYNPFLDPYCVYLEDLPRKVIWNTSFNHAFDFFYVI